MKRDELLAHLRKNEIFKRTKDADLGRLADLAEVFVVPKDGRILEEGDPSEHLFVLVQGIYGLTMYQAMSHFDRACAGRRLGHDDPDAVANFLKFAR